MQIGIARKLLVVFALLLTLPSFAQRNHFVYIQADNQQPFYLKYNNKTYSSSSIGYLILSRLTDGDFTVQIGFPKDIYPEQTFNLSVNGTDLGYALKNFDTKGWGLFNFQTTDIVMNVNAAAATEQVAKQITTLKSNNAFGNMLADAINDTTLNQQTVPARDTASRPAAVSADATPTTPLPAYDTQAAVDSLVKKYSGTAEGTTPSLTPADSANTIVKSSEKTTSSGTDLTFLDTGSKDTIRAFIPSSEPAVTVEEKAAMADSIKGKISNPFFADSTHTAVAANPQPAMPDTASLAAHAITNSNCQAMMSTFDMNKLRKKIGSEDKQDVILAAIRKSLRGKCVTTDQVKELGNLFSSDENRYGFYDAVYPNVSDYFNFAQLQSTLIDTYYKNRFKALLR